MATGSIFKLITNDGKQDRILMATQLLNQRLYEIEKIRTNNPQIIDPTPTLTDIERTHILFMNAHFKPFVAIGYEYNITRPDSGEVRFGGSARFSIPQFGDFFHDMCLHVVLTDLRADSVQYAADPPGEPDNELLPLVNDHVRYCEYPGERLLQQVRFEVNGNPLDTYNTDDYIFYRQAHLLPHKRHGWNRNMGQQDIYCGSLQHNPGSENFAEIKYFTSGAQTWKTQHERLELWIPLLFWFNLDYRQAIPSVAIPYGQRFIHVDIATIDKLVQARSYRGNTPQYTIPQISEFELYINNIFVNPEIHDIFIKRIGFSLIRVHLHQRVQIDQNINSVLLSKIKWPVETLYCGLRPISNDNSLQNWHLFSNINEMQKTHPVAYPPTALAPDVPALGFSVANWRECTPTFDTLGLRSHDIDIYADTNAQFYNSYIPVARGRYELSSPEDCGIYILPFNLEPHVYQPSGHLNLSRARESYLHFTCSSISSENRATLIISARALNFLLLSDGSCILRYAT